MEKIQRDRPKLGCVNVSQSGKSIENFPKLIKDINPQIDFRNHNKDQAG